MTRLSGLTTYWYVEVLVVDIIMNAERLNFILNLQHVMHVSKPHGNIQRDGAVLKLTINRGSTEAG